MCPWRWHQTAYDLIAKLFIDKGHSDTILREYARVAPQIHRLDRVKIRTMVTGVPKSKSLARRHVSIDKSLQKYSAAINVPFDRFFTRRRGPDLVESGL